LLHDLVVHRRLDRREVLQEDHPWAVSPYASGLPLARHLVCESNSRDHRTVPPAPSAFRRAFTSKQERTSSETGERCGNVRRTIPSQLRSESGQHR
jgi:hypothetical protein